MSQPGQLQDFGGDQGDGYLASVSDLMAGLLFFFLITLAVFALRLEVSRAEQEEKRAQHEEKLDQWEALEDTRERILEDLESRLSSLGLTVEVDPEQGILRLSDEGIFFPSGRAVPEAEYLPNVGKLATALMEVVPCYVSRRLPIDAPARSRPSWCLEQSASPTRHYECDTTEYPWKVETLLIEGHTDSVPIRHSRREFKDNLQLSAARAAEVLRRIRQCEPGIDGLLNLSGQRVVSVSGYAETRPVNAADTEASENRRIDLRFMMEPPRTLLDGREVTAVEPKPATDLRGVVNQ